MQGIPLARRHAAGHLLRLKSSNRLLPSATLKEPSRAFTDERNTSSSFNTVAVGAAGGVIILFGGGYAFYHFSGIKRVVDAYHGAKAYYQNKKAATSEKAQRFKERFIRSQSSTEPHSESVAMAKENGTLFSRIPRRGDAHEGATAGGVDEPKSQTASTDNVKEQRKKLRDLRKSGASGSRRRRRWSRRR